MSQGRSQPSDGEAPAPIGPPAPGDRGAPVPIGFAIRLVPIIPLLRWRFLKPVVT